MDWEFGMGVITGLLLLVFLGICVWAYSSERKAHFDEAAKSALDDDGAGK